MNEIINAILQAIFIRTEFSVVKFGSVFNFHVMRTAAKPRHESRTFTGKKREIFGG